MAGSSDKKISVVIADDQQVLRVGLTAILSQIEDVCVIGQAKNGQEALELAQSEKPAIIFMDIAMPTMDGIEATQRIKDEVPETRVIMFTSMDDEDTFLAALRSGADAYCMKNASEQQLAGAVSAVLQGAKWLDSKLANRVLNGQEFGVRKVITTSLNTRQRQILEQIQDGHNIAEIAIRMNTTVSSIKPELKKLLDQLQPPETTVTSEEPMEHLSQLLGEATQKIRSHKLPTRSDEVGAVISGRYRIEGVIGSGGMGMVYKARHLLMNKVVAVKTLHSHLLGDATLLRRLQTEAQAAGSISHPNIVSILDFLIDEHKQPYLVMDYVPGEPLSNTLTRNKTGLPLGPSLNLFIQMCEGLTALHKNEMVHRDLKPSNIMIVGNENDLQVKIVDFGLAKILTTKESGHRLTATSEIFGSPLYMSPEQCLGVAPDQRSDFYSLGCIMYHTLTGEPPFQGDSAMNTMWRHVHEPPSRLPFLERLRDVPQGLQALIFKLLHKNADRRPQKAADLKNELLKIAQNIETTDN